MGGGALCGAIAGMGKAATGVSGKGGLGAVVAVRAHGATRHVVKEVVKEVVEEVVVDSAGRVIQEAACGAMQNYGGKTPTTKKEAREVSHIVGASVPVTGVNVRAKGCGKQRRHM